MTQDEWDRATPEKRVLHQFLAAMRECARPDGTKLRGDEFLKAMGELVSATAAPRFTCISKALCIGYPPCTTHCRHAAANGSSNNPLERNNGTE